MNKINGIVSNTIKKIAPAFLYIFISANANLPYAIMRKRSRQIKVLKIIDKISLWYNYAEIVNFVRLGIIEQTKKTPEQLLQLMYSTATLEINISGIGKVNPDDLSDEEYAKIQYEEHLKAMNDISVEDTDTDTGVSDMKKIWEWCKKAWIWIEKLFSKSGANESDLPIPKDWEKLFPIKGKDGKPLTNTNTLPTTEKKSNTGTLLATAASLLYFLR